MGSVGGLLGMAGGAGGTGFNTPSGTNSGQLQTAYNNANNAVQNQQQVYGQLQNVAAGQGPNPAQAMLNQATGANVANQAALMAGQRGGAQNVGLLARQAGQQGMQAQQQAAGQGASMEAQQALGALQGAGNMANSITGSQQNEQSILQGANSANNAIQGTLANTTLGGQQNMIGGIMNAGGAATGLIGGKSGLTSLMGAEGGQVPQMPQNGPQSMFGQSLMGMSQQPMMAKGGNVGDKLKEGGHVPGEAKVQGNSYSNDTVKALLSPGEVVIPRSVMQGKDPVRGAAQFVQAVMAKKRKKA